MPIPDVSGWLHDVRDVPADYRRAGPLERRADDILEDLGSAPGAERLTPLVKSIQAAPEFCRYRDDEGRFCGASAEMIVWGKLFPGEALGPRCYDHAAMQVGHGAASDRTIGYAIYHFRPYGAERSPSAERTE